ncbi:hypothetical protein [Actinomadura roseirufa]|uniref:hypothetical protein n=1 Tax=Actinomadura roseirufa TaxID=2094049 RepID=UPI00104146F5|nr:hypothetical protein [Actinomadura roseirufa]
MSGTTQRRRHGLAGLLVALFVVAGLAFSYGLGHAPPARLCTEHSVSVPVDAAAAAARHHPPSERTGPPTSTGTRIAAPLALHGVPALGGSAGTAANAPLSPLPPLDACLCLAVLFTLMVLALLAAGAWRAFRRLPARAGWERAAPAGALPALLSLSSLQVLRL